MMRWLSDMWTREGPGIPKDAPRRRGAALFGEIIWRELWDLFMLNLMIVGFSLPVVTIPATHAAATRITLTMVKDEDRWLYRDFWKAFCSLFARATLASALLLIPVALGLYAIWIWGQLLTVSGLYAGPLVACAAVTLFFLMIWAMLFVLIAEDDRPLPALIRLAFIATLARPLPVLGAFGFIAALWLLHIALYPISIFMPATLLFSCGVLALSFSCLGSVRAVLTGETTRRFVSASPRGLEEE